MLKRFIQWHKNTLDSAMQTFGVSAYAVAWISFVKGLIIGYWLGV